MFFVMLICHFIHGLVGIYQERVVSTCGSGIMKERGGES